MKKAYLLIIILLFSFISFAQEEILYSCGTPPSDIEEVSKRSYYGNNKYLVNLLRDHGLDLPDDYFESIDNDGLYKGRNLLLNDVRQKRDQSNDTSDDK